MNFSNIKFEKSIEKLSQKPSVELPEIAIVGRSNAGKSSLINKIFNQKKLAKTSSTPGKTRLINYFNIDDKLFLVDLPGYGYAKVSRTESNKWKVMIEEYISSSPQLISILVLIDARHGPLEKDRVLIDWLNHLQKKYFIVLTKIDKISKSELKKTMTTISKKYPNKIIPFSAKSGVGTESLLIELENVEQNSYTGN